MWSPRGLGDVRVYRPAYGLRFRVPELKVAGLESTGGGLGPGGWTFGGSGITETTLLRGYVLQNLPVQ